MRNNIHQHSNKLKDIKNVSQNIAACNNIINNYKCIFLFLSNFSVLLIKHRGSQIMIHLEIWFKVKINKN